MDMEAYEKCLNTWPNIKFYIQNNSHECSTCTPLTDYVHAQSNSILFQHVWSHCSCCCQQSGENVLFDVVANLN